MKTTGRIVFPLDVRRKFLIEEGTRVGFLEVDDRLMIQPITDAFIDSMKGVVAGHRLPNRVGRNRDRNPR
jgi:bifunctional DNA-binding transcriptional regulator/antitoxin component of YhaV-PrlF toxin-antitoxin module